MSISDKIASIEIKKSGRSCAMCAILVSLNSEDREAITSAMTIPPTEVKRVTDRQIAEVLKSEGYDISHNQVFRHRQNHMDTK